jgi:hypothetical protein
MCHVRLTCAVLALAVFATAVRRSGGQEPESSLERISVDAKVLPRINPGTTVGSGAPVGWTHLVFKARSRLTSGATNRLPHYAQSLTELLFTTMVARVRPQGSDSEGPYHLQGVAVGLGIQIGNRDVVISSATHKQLGAQLGPLKVMALSFGEQRLDEMYQVAATPTMLVVDAYTALYLDGSNQDVVLRYCFLVEPASGNLASLVWPIRLDDDGRYRGVEGTAVLIRSSLVATTPLHVDGDEIFAGIPSPRAVAAAKLPEGFEFALPKSLRAVAGQQRFAPASTKQLEEKFREIVQFP